jgi:hypothetical protein
MSAFVAKARLYSWGALQAFRFGRPDLSLGYLGGIGDDLLCTAPIAEWLQRGAKRIWFFTRHPGLYSHFDSRVQLITEDPRLLQLAAKLRRPMRPLSYSNYDAATDRDSALTEHIVAAMCRNAGLTGCVRLRPYLSLNAAEVAAMSRWSGFVAVQSSSLSAVVPMQNKQWRADRLTAVIAQFAGRVRFVQIGSPADPALPGADDLRGRTSLRATAALLANARLLLGIPGFLMHLARAVECPAVIVYGGREPPELTGYPCNLNLAQRPPCAPCWQRSRCDFNHSCTDAITAADVAQAVETSLDRARGPLAEFNADL